MLSLHVVTSYLFIVFNVVIYCTVVSHLYEHPIYELHIFTKYLVDTKKSLMLISTILIYKLFWGPYEFVKSRVHCWYILIYKSKWLIIWSQRGSPPIILWNKPNYSLTKSILINKLYFDNLNYCHKNKNHFSQKQFFFFYILSYLRLASI